MSTDADGLILREDLGHGVTRLLLNRPDRLNALNDDLIEALVESVDTCSADAAVRVIIVAGAGRSFSAGADASGGGQAVPRTATDDRQHMLHSRIGRFLSLWDAPKPIIAQVHGHCLGLAAALCSCVDLVVVADDATIGWPLPLGGGILGPSWTFYVGARKAKEYSFQASSRLTGREAVDMGWANTAVPAAGLDDHVRRLAQRIARTPPGLLRLKKEAINSVYDRIGFRDTIRMGATWDALAHTEPQLSEVHEIVRREGLKGANLYYQQEID